MKTPMTVGQLIKALSKFPEDYPVIVVERGGMYDSDIKGINPDDRGRRYARRKLRHPEDCSCYDCQLKVKLTVGCYTGY